MGVRFAVVIGAAAQGAKALTLVLFTHTTVLFEAVLLLRWAAEPSKDQGTCVGVGGQTVLGTATDGDAFVGDFAVVFAVIFGGASGLEACPASVDVHAFVAIVGAAIGLVGLAGEQADTGPIGIKADAFEILLASDRLRGLGVALFAFCGAT